MSSASRLWTGAGQPDPRPPPAVTAVGVDAEDPGSAAGGGGKAFEHLQRGGFASPVRSKPGHKLALRTSEAHAVDETAAKSPKRLVSRVERQ